jgi:hypothetical protein
VSIIEAVTYWVVMACLVALAFQLAADFLRGAKREREDQREWDVDARRRSLRLVKGGKP